MNSLVMPRATSEIDQVLQGTNELVSQGTQLAPAIQQLSAQQEAINKQKQLLAQQQALLAQYQQQLVKARQDQAATTPPSAPTAAPSATTPSTPPSTVTTPPATKPTTETNTHKPESPQKTESTVSTAEVSGLNRKAVEKRFSKGVFDSKIDFIIQTAQKYKVDPKLVLAIMTLETGGGSSKAVREYNNPGGYMDPKSPNSTGFRKFDTLEAGIEAVIKNLAENYIAKGLTTPETIGAKYAPPGAKNDPNGTNGGWPSSVTRIMKEYSA